LAVFVFYKDDVNKGAVAQQNQEFWEAMFQTVPFQTLFWNCLRKIEF